METKSIMQKYIDEHIKSMTIERRGDKFYGTLTDKEGRTFERSKEVSDCERLFYAHHRMIPEDDGILQSMLIKEFEIFFVGVYMSKRAFGDL